MENAFSLEDLVRAQGLALAFIGMILEREGRLEPGEFGRQLALLATVTAEADEAQGTILAAWAGLAIDAAEPTTSPREN